MSKKQAKSKKQVPPVVEAPQEAQAPPQSTPKAKVGPLELELVIDSRTLLHVDRNSYEEQHLQSLIRQKGLHGKVTKVVMERDYEPGRNGDVKTKYQIYPKEN
jgi:hypothetical protein